MGRDMRGQRRRGAFAFEFHVDGHPARDEIEHFVERRYAFAFARVEPPQRVVGRGHHVAAAVRGALERVVVNHDELAVDAVDVEFDRVDADAQRARERSQACSRVRDRRRRDGR